MSIKEFLNNKSVKEALSDIGENIADYDGEDETIISKIDMKSDLGIVFDNFSKLMPNYNNFFETFYSSKETRKVFLKKGSVVKYFKIIVGLLGVEENFLIDKLSSKYGIGDLFTE